MSETRLIIYNDEIHLVLGASEFLPRVGDKIPAFRGNGPREGDRMGTATITKVYRNGRMSFHVMPDEDA